MILGISPWIDYKFQLINIQYDDDKEDDNNFDSHTWIIIAGCILGCIVLIIIIFIIVKNIRKKSRKDINIKDGDGEMNVLLIN